jgi:hypothetical protein
MLLVWLLSKVIVEQKHLETWKLIPICWGVGSKNINRMKARLFGETVSYLRVLFAKLPQAETVEEIESLLPGNIDLNLFK